MWCGCWYNCIRNDWLPHDEGGILAHNRPNRLELYEYHTGNMVYNSHDRHSVYNHWYISGYHTMYYIKIHTEPNHIISAEYNIPANIIIFNRRSHIDGEIVDVSIGMTIDEFESTAKEIDYQKWQHKIGVSIPDNAVLKPKGEGWYADEM